MTEELDDVEVTPADLADPEIRALVRQELADLLMAEAVQADLELLAVGRHNHAYEAQRGIDGIGRHEMSMPATLYHFYKHVEKLDFSNPKDREWLMRRFPAIRVPGRQTTKLQVGFERNVREEVKVKPA